ncbi:ATP-binding protein [Streptomyces sp. CA-111067]|uniref:ATP-binding protein n=1 Tax=Streptomyces sp. CA-111067 TaxID=3240046 RepID=UPI003D958ACE
MPYGFLVPAEDVKVSAARRKVVRIVRAWGVPLTDEALGYLALMASEVITNAIRYSQAPCAVAMRWSGTRVRVEVTDTEPGRPVPRDGALDAEGGRGLLLVGALADDWGCAAVPGGKTVWFEIGPAARTAAPATSPAAYEGAVR